MPSPRWNTRRWSDGSQLLQMLHWPNIVNDTETLVATKGYYVYDKDWGEVDKGVREMTIEEIKETMKRHQFERIIRPQVLDVCCGPKGMWFDKNDERAVFMDKRRETHVDVYPCGTKTNVIDPDILGDFTNIPFPDNSFSLVVFDPPHIEQDSVSQITKKYGSLSGDWREMLRAGFAECFRVLKPDGVLIFKWNDCRFPVKEILALTPEKPLFGHKSGKKMGTHWVAFMRSNTLLADAIRKSEIT